MAKLHVVTGKGGVGKTTYAMALTNYFIEKGHRTFYVNLFDQESKETLEELSIPSKHFEVSHSMKSYIARKLGSEMIAKWISEAKFFKALFNILPSLGMMIVLGHILDELEKDPELKIVLDAPATGHALTLFDSTNVFKKIFKEGTLVKDIVKINQFLYDESKVQFHIISLPSELSLGEGQELESSLRNMGYKKSYFILNDALSLSSGIQESSESLPEFLKKKIEYQKEVTKSFEDKLHIQIPFIAKKDPKEIVTKLSSLLNQQGEAIEA
ncbi:MAG: ArsA-related P-loop ATPase [Bacteriovoracaceae bacterium]